MLFSVLIANYNNSQYIRQAIDSVLAQTYQNFEIIIVDDCSTDNSISVISPFLTDKRIKLLRNNRNRGVGYTKKRLIDFSRGEILGFLDPDDALTSNAVEIMVDKHEKNPEASLIYSTNYICDDKLAIVKINELVGSIPNNDTYLTMKSCTNKHISALATFKRGYYKKNEGLNPCFKKAIDKDLYYKLEEVGKTVFVDQPLYYYRQHSGSISLNKNAWLAALWEVRAKEKAYYRRLGTHIPNISKVQIYEEYHNVYKNLTLDCLKDKTYIKYLKYCWLYLCKFRSPYKTARFVYYTLRKNYLT